MLFWRYWKDRQTFFRYFGYAWLHTPKMVVSTCKRLWSITRDLEFYQIWDRWWNFNNNISFHFRLFSRKTSGKIFQNIQKTIFWGTFWALFPQIWAKMKSPGKRALSVFKYYNYHRCAKNQKKLISYAWEKCQTDGRTDNCDFIGLFVGQGSNY